VQILFFYQYFGTPKGSWSTRVYELTRRWVAAGHTVTVVTTPYDKSDIDPNGFISSLYIEGVKVIVVNSGDSNLFPVWKRVFRAVVFSIMAMYYAVRLKADVIVASSGPITIGLPLIAAKLLRRRKTVFEVRDLWPSGGIELGLIKPGFQSKLGFWFEKVCYTNADYIVTASVGQKDHILKRFPKNRIEVIPNASDLELFGTPATEMLPGFTEGKVLFTHIGSLGLIHNTTYWIDVARELKARPDAANIVLVFIGEGADRAKLEAQKDELGLDNLKFLGLKPKSQLPVWVQRSCATLFATTSNPVQDTSSPNKVFDSFAAGVPIIQTSRGWIYDLVQEYQCGINVSLDDPAGAAEQLVWLAKHPDLRNVMGAKALTLAQTQFNRELLAQKYLDILAGLLRKMARKPRVVYFYQYFGTPAGSWSTRVYELCKRWVEHGYDVTVVTSPYYKSDIKVTGFITKKEFENIQLIIINAEDSNKHGFLKRLVNSVVFAFTSVYFALSMKYEVAITSSGPLTIGLPGIWAKIFRSKTFVFEVRDLWPQGSIELKKLKNPLAIKLAFAFEGQCYKYADLVVPCSVDMEKSIVSRFPKSKTLVIPNASDSSFYITPHENPRAYPKFLEHKHIFLYAGSLGLMDDCMQIIEAAKLLVEYPIAIVFAGEGAERMILEEEARNADLHNVYFTGLLPKTDIVKWFFLSTASLVTFKDLPVLSSNSPNKMFDSFAAGVPVIQTTKGWIKDLVAQEYCGLNAEPTDPQSIADAMLWMLAHEDERNTMADNALRLAKTEFNRDHLAKKYILAIDALVGYRDKALESKKAIPARV
jgi:glycosyltransferase involved in cell wall biosynthesis